MAAPKDNNTPNFEADGAAIRVDEAVAVIQRPVENLVRKTEYQRRHLRLVSVVLVFDILFSGAIAYLGVQANKASSSARHALTVSCEAGNEFKKLDLQRWNYIINLSAGNPQPNQTPAERARSQANLKTFQQFLALADAPRDCPK